MHFVHRFDYGLAWLQGFARSLSRIDPGHPLHRHPLIRPDLSCCNRFGRENGLMPKTFRPWQPEQTTLLPPSPSDWLSDDHQLYFLLDLVDELDLSQILIPAQSKDPRGE